MEDFAESLIKSITRYLIPGVVFAAIIVYLPLYFFVGYAIFDKIKLFDWPVVLVLCLASGYMLDSIGAYRYTFGWKDYNKSGVTLIKYLKEETEKQGITFINLSKPKDNPDRYLNELWLFDHNLYERLFVERAEWVMILETSFSLWFASIVTTAWIIFELIRNFDVKYFFYFIVVVVLLVLSFISSKTGIQRMLVHDEKVLKAVSSLSNESVKKSKNFIDKKK